MPTWGIVVCATVAVFLLIVGIRFRLGLTRRGAQFHEFPDYPFYARYLGISLPIFGVTIALVAIGGF